MAGTGYEPVVYGLLYGSAAATSPSAIVEAVLTPLVTEMGREELDTFIGRPASEAANEDPPRPSLLEYLRSTAQARMSPPPRRARAGGAR
jgi:hypothetical protein